MDEDTARSILGTAQLTPIAQLSPDLSDIEQRVVDGEITLTWPFSIVTKTIGFKLVECEPRLRRDKGQIRVDFLGAAGKAVAAACIGGGDRIRLSLQGVEWDKLQASSARPDTVDWQLKFKHKLILSLRRPDSDEEELIRVDSSQVEDAPADESPLRKATPTRDARGEDLYNVTPPLEIPATDVPMKRLASTAFSGDEFASPAFLKRARVSYGALWEGGLDIFDEEPRKASRKKRSRFSMHANWRYTSQSPSPEPEEQSEVESEAESEAEPEVENGNAGEAQAARSSPEPTIETPSRQPMADKAAWTQIAEAPSPIPAEPPPEPKPEPAELPKTPSPIDPPRPSYLPNGSLTGDSANLFEQVHDMRPAGLPQLDTMRARELSAVGTPEGFIMDFTNSHTLVQPPVPGIDISPRPVDVARSSGFGVPGSAEEGYGYVPDDLLPHATAQDGQLDGHGFHSVYPEVPQTMPHVSVPMGYEQLHYDPSPWPSAVPSYVSAPLAPHSSADNPVEIIDSSSQVAPSSPAVSHRVDPADDSQPASQIVEDDEELNGRHGAASGSSPSLAESDEASGDYSDGGDQSGEDYDLRNYAGARYDDDTGNEEVSDKAGDDPNSGVIDGEESDEDTASEDEHYLERADGSILSQQSEAHSQDEAPSDSDMEGEDYAGHYESSIEGDYDEEEGEDEEGDEEEDEEEEEERNAKPQVNQEHVCISLLSDSEDEEAEKEQSTQLPQRMQAVESGVSLKSEDAGPGIEAPAVEEAASENIADEDMQSRRGSDDEDEDAESEMEIQSPIGAPTGVSTCVDQPRVDSGDDDLFFVLEPDMAENEHVEERVDEEKMAEEKTEEVPRSRSASLAETRADDVDDDMADAAISQESVSQDKEVQITTQPEADTLQRPPRDAEIEEGPALTEEDIDMEDAPAEPKITCDDTEKISHHDQTPKAIGEQVADIETPPQPAAPLQQGDAEVRRSSSPSAHAALGQSQTTQPASPPPALEHDQTASAEIADNSIATLQDGDDTETVKSSHIPTEAGGVSSELAEPESLSTEQTSLPPAKPQEGSEAIGEVPKTQTTALEAAARPSTPNETQQAIEVQSQVIESSDEEDYSMAVEHQIMTESQEHSYADQGEHEVSPRETQAQRRAKSKAKPKRERDILITVQSLRSWDHRKSMSSNATDGDYSQDSGAALARAPSQASPSTAFSHEGGTAPLIRVTRSMTEAIDPSIALARASRSSTPRTTQPNTPREVTPEVAKKSPKAARTPKRSQRVREKKTPEPAEANQPNADEAANKAPEPEPRTPEPKADSSLQSSPAFLERSGLRTLKLQLKKELRSNLPDCLPLSDLQSSLGRTTDVVALVTKTPPQPHRPKSGPRDYMLELILADPSTGPSAVCAAHVFRQHQAGLPVARAGDAVLLRRFQVVSMRGRGYGLRSKDESCWAVYERADEEMLAQIRGPPMEVSDEVVRYVKGLREWWAALDDEAMRKMERSSHRAAMAGLGEGKTASGL